MTTFEEKFRASISGAYDIERELSGAGMSRVFVAMDRALGRRVVIKVLPPELTAGVNRDRFRREVQVAAQLQHPHIVTLLSAGEDGDILYYTMPFIEGESLRSALEKGPLQVRDVVRILHDVVDALAYAHARGVVHRDIKPGNILKLGQHALVTDFGVAKALNDAMPVSGITTAGMAIGTPAYMAPEQLAGDPAADHRIDIYAVGLLAYELLTGESPFTGPSPQATMAAQLTRIPEPLYLACPDVAPPLSAIIMQCLAKEPEKRPPTAEALMAALDSITISSGDIKNPLSPTLPAVSRRKRRITLAAAVATVVIASTVAVFASQQDYQPQLANVRPEVVTAAAADSGAEPSAAAAASAQATAPVPVVLTRADSLAIAEAVRKRLAEEESTHGRRQIVHMTDSIVALARKLAIDSIIRATLPAGMAIPGWSEEPPIPPRAPSTTRRVAVIEPRPSRQGELNEFAKVLSDSIRISIARRNGYRVVDPDSVNAALGVSRARADVERALKPDVLIMPTFVGMGDEMTALITLRDVANPQMGTRIASGKFRLDDPGSSISALVGLVGSQLDNQRAFTFRVAPSARVRGTNER
ncbi:MAG: serine/threonine-protein kinase [Gemmatimonadaceae bacterium]